VLDEERCRELPDHSNPIRSQTRKPNPRLTSTTATLASNLRLRRQTAHALTPAITPGTSAAHLKPVVPHQSGSASVPASFGTRSKDAMNAHQDMMVRRKGMAIAVPCGAVR
jgi:hypothetical protein